MAPLHLLERNLICMTNTSSISILNNALIFRYVLIRYDNNNNYKLYPNRSKIRIRPNDLKIKK